MDNILDKINQAYAKGINNPRFKDAIEELIIEPTLDEKARKLNNKNAEIVVDEIDNEQEER